MNIPVSDIDFYSDDVIKDPYPVYAQLRELGPVVYMQANDLYLVARYQEVSEVLLQPRGTINDKLVANGINVPVSCQSGLCGTCLTKVLEGVPDHRDFVQTDLEKASNEKITVCCSRSKSNLLVLDI